MPKPSGSDSMDGGQQVEEDASPSPRLSGCRPPTAETRKKKFPRQGKRRITRKSSEHSDPEKRRTLEHYLNLKSSGWVPDGSGKWVKDENVEFDSDEEEPPEFPPP
ncbi:PREDICTED: sodium channel modifier 1 [Thamnophis sirtalis]|uniref:Sodium channel modifier 1 n=1 Tax=Thamnophis sirtalis TaxID=35019 RepID=A0A6I9Z1E2_9SAUR|nr:PREDICTED: sodium channel modifier 1 [Thamnophis sirtalis]